MLSDLSAARAPGEEKRPSVETLLHSLFPQTYVVHTHPALINGLTCGREGEQVFDRLFPDEAIWVPFIEPGYTLAKAVSLKFDTFVAEKGFVPHFMLMQNHGLLVAADTPNEIGQISTSIVQRIRKTIAERHGCLLEPNFKACTVNALQAARCVKTLEGIYTAESAGTPFNLSVLHHTGRAVFEFARSAESFAPLTGAFSPDHIVYAGHEFLRVNSEGELGGAMADYQRRNGSLPRIVLVKDLGAFAISHAASGIASASAATRAMELFLDACKIATYSAAFGGALHMTPQAVEFIRTWEVEQYRAKIAASSSSTTTDTAPKPTEG